MRRITRRTFLRRTAELTLSGGVVLLSSWKPTLPGWNPTTQPDIPAEDAMAPTAVQQAFEPDVEIDLLATQRQVQILSGSMTTVWTYQGTLVKGDPSNLQAIDTYPGPIIRVHKGQRVGCVSPTTCPNHPLSTGMGCFCPPYGWASTRCNWKWGKRTSTSLKWSIGLQPTGIIRIPSR